MAILSDEAREYFRKQGRRGGKIGAKARMEKLTPEQRTEYARNAGRKRWANGTAAALVLDTEPAESPNSISHDELFRDGADQRNHERNLKRQERKLRKA